MPQTKLIVARHGNTFNKGDVILRVGARTDLPLTEEGKLQGRKLGEKIRANGLVPTVYFSAPLVRTIETAREASKAFGTEQQPNLVEFLTELDYGEYDGRPEQEVVQRLGEIEAHNQNLTELLQNAIESLGKEVLKRWDTDRVLPSAWQFLQSRVNLLDQQWRDFSKDIVQSYPGETVLVTTSNGIARFSLSILPQSASIPGSLKLSTGAYGLFVWNGDMWKLEAWNVK